MSLTDHLASSTNFHIGLIVGTFLRLRDPLPASIDASKISGDTGILTFCAVGSQSADDFWREEWCGSIICIPDAHQSLALQLIENSEQPGP